MPPLARPRTFPQHTLPLLPLLRSRPGGVHKASVVRSPGSDKKLSGGEGGIRTHGTVSRSQHFQCCQFNHSCTSPNSRDEGEGRRMKSRKFRYFFSFLFHPFKV